MSGIYRECFAEFMGTSVLCLFGCAANATVIAAKI